MLAALGHNQYGEPLYRIIWSDRKMVYFMGEYELEARYAIFERPYWVLETWTPPEKDAGPKYLWDKNMEFLMGPYPSEGYYNFVTAFDADFEPTQNYAIHAICVALQESSDIPMDRRVEAIKEALQEKERAGVKRTAEAIMELQDSASMGRIQAAVSGPKNNLRTVADFERDAWKRPDEIVGAPKTGGRIVEAV
jgi:hypothetical protein